MAVRASAAAAMAAAARDASRAPGPQLRHPLARRRQRAARTRGGISPSPSAAQAQQRPLPVLRHRARSPLLKWRRSRGPASSLSGARPRHGLLAPEIKPVFWKRAASTVQAVLASPSPAPNPIPCCPKLPLQLHTSNTTMPKASEKPHNHHSVSKITA